MTELALAMQALALFVQVVVLVLVIRQDKAVEEACKRCAEEAAYEAFEEILSGAEALPDSE